LELKKLKEELIKFRKERDWEQFHDPKNLAEAIAIESGELLEKFLWKTVEQSKKIDKERIENIKSEVSDILNYCIYLAEELEFDIIEEAYKKIGKNAVKYPVDKAKGNAKKYTKF